MWRVVADETKQEAVKAVGVRVVQVVRDREAHTFVSIIL